MSYQQPSRQHAPVPGPPPPSKSAPWGSIMIAVGAVLTVLGVAALLFVGGFIAYLLFPFGLIVLIVGIVLAVKQGRPSPSAAAPVPTGYTVDGRPIYPVVGYTPDGRPVTADQAVGYVNPRTNALAIVALVLGLIFPLAAIPVGHISRSQIKRTGEQGSGLAIAGLVLGYLGLAGTIVMVFVFIANS